MAKPGKTSRPGDREDKLGGYFFADFISEVILESYFLADSTREVILGNYFLADSSR